MTTESGNPDTLDSFDELIACPGCDLLHHRQSLQLGELARCERCNDIVQTRKESTVDRSLAAVLAGIILMLLSLSLPFLSLSRAGVSSEISVLDAVSALWLSDMRWLGFVTLAFIVMLPLARLALLGWVLWRIRFDRKIRSGMRTAFRWAIRLEPWAMADIFMVGVVVSLVKISTLANLHVGLAFWSLLALVAVSVYLNLALCKDTVWACIIRRP
ncbi:MAG: paraquat-inducible protein A [Granulosicoccus sp.]|nr:paraquat-inducible protein A [Granulosicoccus sp.]